MRQSEAGSNREALDAATQRYTAYRLSLQNSRTEQSTDRTAFAARLPSRTRTSPHYRAGDLLPPPRRVRTDALSTAQRALTRRTRSLADLRKSNTDSAEDRIDTNIAWRKGPFQFDSRHRQWKDRSNSSPSCSYEQGQAEALHRAGADANSRRSPGTACEVRRCRNRTTVTACRGRPSRTASAGSGHQGMRAVICTPLTVVPIPNNPSTFTSRFSVDRRAVWLAPARCSASAGPCRSSAAGRAVRSHLSHCG